MALLTMETAARLRPLYIRMWEEMAPRWGTFDTLAMGRPQWGDLYPHAAGEGLLVVDGTDYVHALPPSVLLTDEGWTRPDLASTEWAETESDPPFVVRILRALSGGLYGRDDDWARRVALTPLCKVFDTAPGKTAVSEDLRQAQLRAATAILFAELEVLSPRIAVVLANEADEPLLRALVGRRRYEQAQVVGWGYFKPLLVVEFGPTTLIVAQAQSSSAERRLHDVLLNVIRQMR